MNLYRIASVALVGLISTAAHASLITVDPNSFALGTDVSNATANVTLSSFWQPIANNVPEGESKPPAQFSSIYILDCGPYSSTCGAIDGYVFGHDAHTWPSTSFAREGAAATYLENPLAGIGAFEVFRADFANGTNFAQLIVGGSRIGEFPRLDAWGFDGTLLGTCATPGGQPVPSVGCGVVNIGNLNPSAPDYRDPWLLSFSTSSNDIAFVTAGGWAGTQYVSSLTFNNIRGVSSVPEPGTLALMLAGVVALALRRRRFLCLNAG
jgi:hypothetical protein